ncbi:MAG: hypothetical protein ACJ77E_08460 [Gaiellaceae bacterium]
MRRRLASPSSTGSPTAAHDDAGDARLPDLLAALEALGETPLVRAERTWSKRDLDDCDRLLLRVKTAGLDGGVGLGQAYDRSRACGTCGAGAVPLPPLVADLPRMGRKHIDATAHDGLLVASAALADALVAEGVTGLAVEPVRSRSARYPADAHRWLRVLWEWPPCRADSVIHRDRVCAECGRSGHYDTFGAHTELRYDAVPADACDCGRSWEYWGLWQGPPPGARVGGAQQVIVSQRVRATFARVGVRRIAFEPVVVGNAG